jgi:DNA polymerase III sliding clamp (beta) subunit (PCNA family)
MPNTTLPYFPTGEKQTMFILDSDILKSMLDAVSRATSISHPAYSVVSLKVSGGRISIAGFNGEFGIEARAGANGDGEMSVCVNAATFHEIAGTISGLASLGIDPKAKNKLKLESGSSKSTLNIVDSEAFPPIDSDKSIQVINLTGSMLKSIGRVLSFTSPEESRPALKGAILCLSANALDAYAADGFTGAWVSEPITNGPETPKNFLLPAKFLRELLKLAGADDDVAVKVVDEKRYIFHITNKKGKEITLTSSVIDGNFPLEGIKNLYAGEGSSTRILTTIPKPALNIAIRHVSAMGTQNMFLRASNGFLRAASPETEIGQARNTLTDNISGEFKLWVRADYVLRAIDSLETEVQMTFVNGKSPLYFKGGTFRAMVMPVDANLKEPVFDDDPQEALALSLTAQETPALTAEQAETEVEPAAA